MSKKFIADIIQDSAQLSGERAYAVAGDVIEAIKQQIRKDDTFTVPGFGRFEVCKLKARKAINPRTQERIKVKSRKTVRFRACPGLRASI